jgi:hypothetical protein
VIGGMCGYAIGVFLEPVGTRSWLLRHPDGQAEFQHGSTSRAVDHPGQGRTPIPYKLVTITAGSRGSTCHLRLGLDRDPRRALLRSAPTLIGISGRRSAPRWKRRWTSTPPSSWCVLVGAFVAIKVLGEHAFGS